MSEQNPCPKCKSTYCYENENHWICSECAFEWNPSPVIENLTPAEFIVKDAHGNVLKDGDSISVIKDLKVKGASSSVKVGTKVKNIRLQESNDGHNIGCKIDGFGQMNLKSEFVKKI